MRTPSKSSPVVSICLFSFFFIISLKTLVIHTRLLTGLTKWERTFNNQGAQGKTYSAPGGPWKAALLSGPPGIGKTTTATLVAEEAGRDILEYNASDVRSKKAIATSMGDVTGSQVLNFQAKGSKKASIKLRCIIMDEVDGMGAGDRSGMSELIQMIKKSMVPIICICNDRQSQKIKSLLPYCMDLRFRRPTKQVIARRAIRIAESEGMRIEQNAAEAIADSCGNDIRQVMNCMQMWSNKKPTNGSLTMTYKEFKERGSEMNKDEMLRVGIFDATKMIIEGPRGMSGADPAAVKDNFYKRNNAFFVDYSLIGLNVHQNYLKVMISSYNDAKKEGDAAALKFLERMHDATLTMSDYAVAEQAIRGGDMNWSLLPFSGMLTVKAGFHASGENGGFLPGFPEFTAWMGKNSTRGKKNRILQELGYHMNYKVSGGLTELRLNYIPLLRDRFAALLFDEDGSKVSEAISLMDEYGLDRDDVFENMEEFKMGPDGRSFATLDSKQKAAFTRQYNSGTHKSQALVAEQGAGKVTKKKAPKEKDPADLDAVDDDAFESESEEDEEAEAAKLQAIFKKKGRGGGTKTTGDGKVGSKKAKK
jgi:replication factor C subunit 1